MSKLCNTLYEANPMITISGTHHITYTIIYIYICIFTYSHIIQYTYNTYDNYIIDIYIYTYIYIYAKMRTCFQNGSWILFALIFYDLFFHYVYIGPRLRWSLIWKPPATATGNSSLPILCQKAILGVVNGMWMDCSHLPSGYD